MFSNTTNIFPTKSVYSTNSLDTNNEANFDMQEDLGLKFQLNSSTIGSLVPAVEEASFVDIWDGDIEEVFTLDIDTNIQTQLFRQDPQLYFCKSCDYKSNKQFNVKKHTLSIHDGIRYPCDQCDYKATETGHLKKHKRSKHTENKSF